MCGISGIAGFRKPALYNNKSDSLDYNIFKKYEVFLKLTLIEMHNDGLGSDATGLVIVNKPEHSGERYKIVTYKNNVNAEEAMVQKPSILYKINNYKTLFAIGHVRDATNGAPENNANNHPIIHSTMVGVHNGCVGNYREIMKEHGITPTSECDSEAIFSLLQSKIKDNDSSSIRNAVVETCRNIAGWMTCFAVDSRYPSKLIVIRRGAPLSMAYSYEHKMLVFCSSGKILEKCIELANLGGTKLTTLILADSSARVMDCLNDFGPNSSTVFSVPKYKQSNTMVAM